ncbi:MAG: Lrp/AsnC family transcriptional regulator [Planctomycetota bacterium]
MDSRDAQLLAVLERGLPLVREPYAQLAGALGRPEADVLRRVAVLRAAGGVIREISGVFDAAALGYDRTLVALSVPDARVDAAGRTVAAHPGVSHAYRRTGAVNLWFTLAVSPDSALGPDATAEVLAGACGAPRRLILPAERRYKLHVRFVDGGPHAPPAPGGAPRALRPLTGEQRRAVRALQADLPARADPFTDVAAAEGFDADALLVHASDLLAAGRMRRYAATLRHRRVGARANVLVAWDVPPERTDAAGGALSDSDAVSHCIRRPPRPGWPYAIYTMIHGPDECACRRALAAAGERIGNPPRVELWTLREYAKRRVRFFTDDEAAWEAEYGGRA